MATITKSAPLVALMVFVILAPTAAQAQDERLRISVAPAVATVSGNAELALGGIGRLPLLGTLLVRG